MVLFSVRSFVSVTTLSFIATVANGTTIVDLSKDFEVGNLKSSGAQKVIDAVNQDFTRRFLVLEKGKIVVDYTRPEGVCSPDEASDPSCSVTPDETFVTFSSAKSLDGFAIGLAVDAGLLSVDDTLGDIFTDDSTWRNVNVTQAEYLRGVSIEEILTFSSALYDLCDVGDPNLCPDRPVGASLCFDNLLGERECVSDYCGKDLPSILERLVTDPVLKRGEFSYIQCTGLVSYIFTKVTGQGVREYMASNVFPALGIDNSAIGWGVNSEGVEIPQSTMYLSAYDMAKYGQLYLQKGMSGPNTSLVSADWVNESFTPRSVYSDFGPSSLASIGPNSTDYGYFWYIYTFNDDGVYCAKGAGGQEICIHPESERVYVRKSWPGWGFESSDMEAVFSNTTSFEDEDESDTEPPSAAACARQGRLAVAILAMILAAIM